ncbi:MAG TPA: hypothetical protein VFP72_00765 [Kineosporiaceae bacterium]|nr:hypothetical protein [Kineosporiaceae bacterium]
MSGRSERTDEQGASPAARIGRFFAVDDPWERQGGLDRGDVFLGLVVLALAGASFELIRSLSWCDAW